jgi:hypothetical protein
MTHTTRNLQGQARRNDQPFSPLPLRSNVHEECIYHFSHGQNTPLLQRSSVLVDFYLCNDSQDTVEN